MCNKYSSKALNGVLLLLSLLFLNIFFYGFINKYHVTLIVFTRRRNVLEGMKRRNELSNSKFSLLQGMTKFHTKARQAGQRRTEFHRSQNCERLKEVKTLIQNDCRLSCGTV